MSPEELAEHIFSGLGCLRALLWNRDATAAESSCQHALRDMEVAMHEAVEMEDRRSGSVQGICVTPDNIDRVRRLRVFVTRWLEDGVRPPEIEELARECLSSLLGRDVASNLDFPLSSHAQCADSPTEPLAHAFTVSRLIVLLGATSHYGFTGPGGWVILTRPPVRCGHGLVVPDLAGWRADRFQFPRGDAFMPIPDWVCEVLSPLTALADRGEKARAYIANHVRYAWLVDPADRTLEAFRLENDRWVVSGVFEGDAHVRVEPFDTLELDLSLIWTP